MVSDSSLLRVQRWELKDLSADKVVLSIKGGIVPESHKPDGSTANVRRSVDNCLKILNGTKHLDLFECARVDPNTPVEETIETLAEYVKAGKLGGICLSECGPDTIRRAAAVHKIEGVEVEFSLFATEILHNGVAQACAELDIPVIAYSPLSRGFLVNYVRTKTCTLSADIPQTGHYKTREDINPFSRDRFPRFAEGNFEKNLKLVEEVEALAKRKGYTVGQVAIAWVMAQSGRNGLPIVIPIPGSTTEQRVLENNKLVKLTDKELQELDEFVKTAEVAGDRYGGPLKALQFGESKPR